MGNPDYADMPKRIDHRVIAIRHALAVPGSGKSRKGLAEFMGVEKATITKMLGSEKKSDDDLGQLQKITAEQMDQIFDYLGELVDRNLPNISNRDAPSGNSVDRRIPMAHVIPNAKIAGPVRKSDNLVPKFGAAAGGVHGEFPLNGNLTSYVPAHPNLQGVTDGYAVDVVGESMEPRYLAGETVYVNPQKPVRRGDFVIAQILPADPKDAEGNPPLAFLKRFVSRDEKFLKLEQLNPPEQLKFPASRVHSVHRIVGSASEV